MRRLAIAVASVVGAAALLYFAMFAFDLFSSRTDSDVAFLRVDATIGAYEGESVELMMPYAIQATRNDPLLGRFSEGGDGTLVPERLSIGGIPSAITSHRIEHVARSGRYDVRMLYVTLRFDRAGTFEAERLLVSYPDGVNEAYPLGNWAIEVLPEADCGELAVEPTYVSISANVGRYELPLRNVGTQTVWVSDVRLGGEHAAQSLTLAPGAGMQIDFSRSSLIETHRKSVLRIVRPIVTYSVLGQSAQWMPPAAHLGFSDIDHNAIVQEMDERRQARAALLDAPDDAYDFARNDPDERIAQIASRLTALPVESLLGVLRQERYRPFEVHRWLDSGKLGGFAFTYADGKAMTAQDAQLVWAVRMARYLEDRGLLEDWDVQAYPSEWMGEWLLCSESWEEQVQSDLRGQPFSKDMVSALTLLRNARLSTIGADREAGTVGGLGG